MKIQLIALALLLVILATCLLFYTARADEEMELAKFQCSKGVCTTTEEGVVRIMTYLKALEQFANNCGKKTGI